VNRLTFTACASAAFAAASARRSASFSLAVRGAAGACSGTYDDDAVSSVSTTLPSLSTPLLFTIDVTTAAAVASDAAAAGAMIVSADACFENR
jgi:hypothetical protein